MKDQASLTRPDPGAVIPRYPLFDLLDKARARPMIWITGPPGCGKTALISSYIADRKVPHQWYQIKKNGKEITCFLYGNPEERFKIQTESQEPIPRNLISNIRHQTSNIIVFDDYHEIPDESVFHQIIRSGLYGLPDNLSLIIISRRNPARSLIRACLTHQVETIGWKLLRLTPDETCQIIRLRTDNEPPRRVVWQLYKVTEGWAAGLSLILTKARKENTDIRPLNGHIPKEISDYFSSQALDKAGNRDRDFLLMSALLPRISSETARKVTGNPRSAQILSGLYENNLFIEKSFPDHNKYRYHPLFRTFLMNYAKQRFSEQEMADIYHHTAMALEENGQIEDAIRMLNQAGCYDKAAQMITDHADVMSEQGNLPVVKKLIDALPDQIVRQTPWLAYWKGFLLMPSDPRESRSYFETAFSLFRNQGDIPENLKAWAGMIETGIWEIKDVKEADPLIPKIPPVSEQGAGKNKCASGIFTALVFRRPYPSKIAPYAEYADHLTHNCPGLTDDNMHLLFQSALYQICMGDFKRAGAHLSALERMAGSEKASPLIRIKAGYARAVWCQFRGKHKQCLNVVSGALHIAQRTRIHLMDNALIGEYAASVLNMNDHKTAGKLIRTMAPEIYKRPDLIRYHFLKAREFLLREDPDQADYHAGISLKLGSDSGFLFSLAFSLLIKSHTAYALGKFPEADRCLEYAAGIARRTKSRLLKFYELWTRAWYEPDKYLRNALSLGKRDKYLNTFLDQPIITADICAMALDRGIEVRYVQEIIRKRDLLLYDRSFSENWPRPLKIFTLGRFSLTKEGKVVSFTEKHWQKPLEMLKALIALGGREIKNQQIAEALWPDCDGDAAYANFKTTLYRLRKLLNSPNALRIRERCLSLDPGYCWVDAYAFQRTFIKAEAEWDAPGGDIIRLTREALDLYKGAFLPEDISEPWTIPLRDRLRSQFLKIVTRMGDYWEKKGEWKMAAECYHRGIRADNQRDFFYHRLRVCYDHLGFRTRFSGSLFKAAPLQSA